MAPFLTLASMHEAAPAPQNLPWLESWAEWAMHELARTKLGGMQHVTYTSEHKNQLWDDTLMMTALPLAKIGLVLGRPEYVEEAKAQFLLHVTYLFDAGTGLFFHGWQFDDSADGAGGHNFARARWARGNSWVTVAVPDLLDLLDLLPGDAFRVHLTRVLEAQCRALRRLQDASGLWPTLLDVPPSEGSYLESSATAGFAYGILKAVRKGYLAREFLNCGVKAATAVIGKITEAGELVGTSFGTGMGDDLEHYKKIAQTSMPYGQSMAIMALVEFLKLFC
jgi:unsaturated rhamnogalacturonyl hydrolase